MDESRKWNCTSLIHFKLPFLWAPLFSFIGATLIASGLFFYHGHFIQSTTLTNTRRLKDRPHPAGCQSIPSDISHCSSRPIMIFRRLHSPRIQSGSVSRWRRQWAWL